MPYDFTNDVLMLRLIIADTEQCNYQYTDTQLTQMLLFGARMVISEINNIPDDTEYIITIDSVTPEYDISPTPDDTFVNLMVLKAACLITQAQYKEKSIMDGIRASCGPASIAITNSSNPIFKFMETHGPCAMYDELKEKIDYRDLVTNFNVKAVLTPYVDYYRVRCGCETNYR